MTIDVVLPVGARGVGMTGGATATRRRAGEESVHVPDRAAGLAEPSRLLAADLLGGAAQ